MSSWTPKGGFLFSGSLARGWNWNVASCCRVSPLVSINLNDLIKSPFPSEWVGSSHLAPFIKGSFVLRRDGNHAPHETPHNLTSSAQIKTNNTHTGEGKKDYIKYTKGGKNKWRNTYMKQWERIKEVIILEKQDRRYNKKKRKRAGGLLSLDRGRPDPVIKYLSCDVNKVNGQRN